MILQLIETNDLFTDKEAVEKRLFVLEQQGLVTAYFEDSFGDSGSQ